MTTVHHSTNMCEHANPPLNTVAPPTHVLRYLCTVPNAINVWTCPSALAHEPYTTPTKPWSQWNEPISPTSQIVPDTSLDYQPNTMSRRWIVRAAPLHPPHTPLVAYAHFQQTIWYLYASQATQQTITPLQRLRLQCYFLHHAHNFSALWRPHPHREFLYKAYNRGMRQALDAWDLGRWAQLLQVRIAYLPYETHAVICMLHAISHTHNWYTSVAPTTGLIYVAIHTHTPASLLC